LFWGSSDLLEKSRVIKQQSGERSYHIFYQLMADAIPGLKSWLNRLCKSNRILFAEKLRLDRPIQDYHFVSQAEVSIEGVDDKEEMLVTDESFDIMKVINHPLMAIFSY
jgi:myosin heavy chain 6/7